MFMIEKAKGKRQKAKGKSAEPQFRRSSAPLILALCLWPFALLAAGCRQDMHNQPRYEALEPSAFFNDGQAARHPVPHTVPRGALANDVFELNQPGASASTTARAVPTAPQAVNRKMTNPSRLPSGNTPADAMGKQTARQTNLQTSPTTSQPGPAVAGPAVPNQLRPPSAAELNRFPLAITAQVLARGETQYNISCSPCHGRTGYGDGMVVRRGFPRPPSYHTEQLRNATNEHFYDVITNGFGRMWSYADQVEPRDRWAVAAYIRVLQLSQHATLADVPADQQTQLGQPSPNPSPSTGQTERRQR